METDDCNQRCDQTGIVSTSTKVIIAVFVVIFVAVILTCVNYVSVVGDKSLVKKIETDRNYSRRHALHAMRHVISLSESNLNHSMHLAERFPYVVAVTRNSTTLWSYACFASVILMKWIVIAAHCRFPGHTHRAILYHDFARNQTHSFPILFWRIHEKYNRTLRSPKYDIAVAKLNVENYQFTLRPAVFDESIATEVEASVWKTVSTMNKKLYLTNQFDKYDVKIGHAGRCYESYGIEMDDSLICVDTSDSEDCFTHDFGPIYSGDKVVGLLLMKPPDCEMKLSIFTNISYYTNWILKTTND